MKKIALLIIFTIALLQNVFAQTSISCATGSTPTLSTGWVLNGTAAVSGSAIQLTAPSGSQNGQLYYNTLLNVTGCGAFTVDFDFQIIPSSSAFAIADGMAFWFVNPLSGFVTGYGIGLPTNPNGLVLVLDTYDNDGVANDPLVSLYGYPSGSTGIYTEGSTTNRLGNMNNQNFIDDGGWHHVHITYSGGNVSAYFNYSAVPSMTGYFPITTSGYFGFSASTGGAWSTQSVRNIYINYNTISPIAGPGTLCTGSTTTYTDATAGGTWSSSNTAATTIGATTGIATPVGAGVTTFTYAYSSTCSTTLTVTVSPTTLSAITGAATVCPGTPTTLADATTGGTWSSSNTGIATIGATTGVASGVLGGAATITYTAPAGCYTTRALTVNTAPPAITISPAPAPSATVCNNGSLTLTASFSAADNLFPAEGWENGVPTTAGTTTDLWNYIGATPSFWYQAAGPLTTSPATGTAYAGNYVADFNCRSLPSGSTAAIYSPSFSMTGISGATVSFWVYRDVSAYNTVAYNTEGLTVYANTSPAVGGTSLGFVPRRGGAAVTGSLTGTSTVTTSGWQHYTCAMPSGFTGATNYIIFSGYSQNGDNIYLDSVSVTGTLAPPVWTPSTYLYNDAAFATTYTGAALNPVYMHPTGISTVTNITYSVSATNGTCSSSGTAVVTINPNPAAITGPTTTCIGATTTYSSTTTGGSWTSSNTSIATIGSTSGIATAITPGVVTFTYCFGDCCVNITVTVVASPGANTGVTIACQGLTTTLSNSVAGGTWSSSNPAVGTVGSTTGVVTGITLGTTIITYGIATCYATTVITVNPVPTPITGTTSLCIGTTTTLASTPTPGIWTSSTTSVATVGITSGVVTGVAIGTSTISYRASGCTVTTTVNVFNTLSPLPPQPPICVGSTETVTTPYPGGTWSSSSPAIATIDVASGLVTGISAGVATITDYVGGGCFTTATITVNPTPSAIAGTLSVCTGSTTTLTHPTAGGAWSTTSTNVTVGAGTGIVTGITTGTAIVTYTLPGGCITSSVVTVNPLPAAIGGTLSFCQGTTTTLSNSTAGGTWSMACSAIATVDAATGVVTGVSAGTCTVTYTSADGCNATADITVNPLPSAITGASTVCIGSCITETSSGGGAWISSATTIATVSGAGSVCGTGAGTTTITYALATGCQATKIVTVTPGVAAISGTTGICIGNTTTLSTTTTGITWSSSAPAVATIAGTGTSIVVTGNAVGTSTITATSGAGCTASVIVTVNSVPGAIGGSPGVCVGSTTTLTDGGGGAWASGTPAVGTIDPATGVLTGIAAGTTIITYSLGTGCTTTAVATVNPLPTPIAGTLNICSGTASTLTSTAGGTWTSSTPATATVGVGTGIATGGSVTTTSTTTITYILGLSGCSTTAQLTVNPLPTAITGTATVCVGNTTTLGSTPAGGTWSSSNPLAGTITATTGIVTGIAGGTTTISYTNAGTGCRITTIVTVNALPTAISGTLAVCQGATTALGSTPAGGTWSSGNTAIATVAAGTGIVTGISATPAPGTATITYTAATTCLTTATVTVNPQPATITGSPSLCVGFTTTLGTATAGATWSSGNTAVATIGSSTGIVTGVAAGTSIITCYTPVTGCRRTIIVTVNALPGAITGVPTVCAGNTTTLACTPAGGTWASSNTGVATIGISTGVVNGLTGGTTTITYTVGSGCIQTTTVTVYALPGAITGVTTFSEGSSTTLSSTPAGGTWSSSNLAVATVGTSSGVVYSPACGTANITYTLPSGCRTSVTITSNCLPGVITGTMSICIGATSALHCSPAGGTWSSGNTAVGTINTATGVVTGISAGTTIITYTLPTLTMAFATITVNPLPAAITGTPSVCVGSTTALADAGTGGTWSSSNTAAGTVASASGIVTGIATGSTNIIYTLPTGCTATQAVAVNPLPEAITGTLTVCTGLTTTLASPTPGGVSWSSGTTAVATITSAGVVTGVSAGTAIITCYTINGCITTATVTVNPLPAAITGTLSACETFTTTLASATTGGIWSSSNAAVGTISATGVVSAIATGTSVITYTLPATGCINTAVVTVNGNPAPITGSSGFCNFTYTTMSTTTAGVTWSTINPGVASIDPSTGVITGVSVDTTTVIATTGAGCRTYKLITIIFGPAPVTGPSAVCTGQTIALDNIITGGTWTSSNTSYATVDYLAGIVSGMSTGVATITYRLSSSICFSTHDVTVNPLPAAISGTLGACEGATTALSNSTAGGTWSSSNTAVATISTGGVASAISGGTATISYILPTGCFTTAVLTVNPLPAPITGSNTVCVGSTTALSSSTGGGLWTSSAPGIAYVSSTGMVTGLNDGNATISYTLGTGCSLSFTITVNPLPSAIYGTANACQNDSAQLYDATPGGAWISTDPAIASISGTGLVSAHTAGTVIISYMLATGCAATTVFTVNAVPAAISGSLAVCAGFATNLEDSTPAGTWTSDPSSAAIGSINYITGVVSGITPGTIPVTYTLGTGCKTYATVTVIVLPAVIEGTPHVCVNATVTLSDAVPGGTWSSSNAHAIANAATGVITGVSAGEAVITYTVGTGCFNVLTITVNPLPTPIAGPSVVCEQSTITLTDATPFGSWISTNTSIASIDASTGLLTGIFHGADSVVYRLGVTGCTVSKIITVNVTPPAIGGSSYVCISSPVLLTDGLIGGTWASSNPSVATISTTGLVTPVTLGTTLISYSLGTGCRAVKEVTVSPLPVVYSVTGGGSYCAGGTGMHVGLSGSQTGVSYVLYYGSSATGYLTGTGSPLDFGPLTLAGTYSVQATYTSSGCVRDMAGTVPVTIIPLIMPTVSLSTGSGDSSCPGMPVTLTPVATGSGTTPAYTWSVNGVHVSTAGTYTFIPADGDVVSIDMASSGGCIAAATATGSVTLSVLPSATPSVVVAATPGDTVCQFSAVAFAAVPSYGGSAPSCTWLVNGTAAGTGAAFSYIPVQGDMISLQLTSNYLCRLATTVTSSSTAITVDSLIVPHVTIIADGGLATTVGDTVTLRAIAEHAGPNPTYQWMVNGHPKAGATADTFRSVYHDYDSVTCMVVSSGVCRNIGTSDWVFISVYPAGVQPLSNVATDIKLTPNPNNGHFSLKGSIGGTATEKVQVTVTDMLGQEVYSSMISAVNGKINELLQLDNTLANGMYLLHVKAGDNRTTLHFVIEQ